MYSGSSKSSLTAAPKLGNILFFELTVISVFRDTSLLKVQDALGKIIKKRGIAIFIYFLLQEVFFFVF